MGTHLDAARRLAGPQHDRHGPALLRVIDVDRQEAAFVIMSVEQRELLMAVDDITGVVDIQGDGCGLARITVTSRACSIQIAKKRIGENGN
jgi:hypothetical protein